jgi:hypothetical protein
VWDLLGAIADAFAFAPFGLTLLLAGAYVGWSLHGAAGAVIGLTIGLGFGLWLDISKSQAAKSLRLPIGLTAGAVLLYTLIK